MNETKVIKKLRDNAVIPEIVQKKADDAFASIKKQAQTKAPQVSAAGRHISRRSWKKVSIIAAVAVLAMGTITAGATAYMKWSRSLDEGLRVSVEQKQKLEDSHTTAPIDQVVTDNGITVTAQQSIVDSYYAYLSFKVEGYEVPEGRQPDFETVDVSVNGVGYGSDLEEPANLDETFSSGGSFYDGLTASTDGQAAYADGTPLAYDESGGIIAKYRNDDGSLEYQLILANSRSKGYFINTPVHVEFKNLGTVARAEYAPDLEGSWSFDFTLQGSDDHLECELNTPLGNSGATAIHAEISPISLLVNYNFPRQEIEQPFIDENGNDAVTTTYAEPPELAGVQLKDGTLLPYLYEGPGSFGYVSEDSDVYKTAFPIDRILDVGQVKSLLFIKSYPEGEGGFTEDNFYIVPIS